MLRILNDIDLGVSRLLVENDIPSEEGILGLDDHRPADELDLSQLDYRDLRSTGCGYEDFAELLDAVAKLSLIANANRIAFATFHSCCQLLAADSDFDHVLHLANAQAVSRDLLPIDINLEVGFTYNAVGNDGGGFD